MADKKELIPVEDGWFNPGDMLAPAGVYFQPSTKQTTARELVMEMIDDGKTLPDAWIREFKKRAADTNTLFPAMSSAEWREWSNMTGFMDWFYEGLYTTITEHQLKSLDLAFFRGLQQTLDVGNPAGLRLYAELRGFFDRKNDESGIGDFLRGTPTAAIQPAAITWSEVAQIEEAEELDEDES